MTTFVPTAEDMQALVDLQQVVANLRTYLGLAPVASTLASFPHGATGSPTALSPPPRAASDSRRATGDADRKLSTVKKQSRVEPLRTVNPATPDEERHDNPLNAAAYSFPNYTHGNGAKPTPQPLIPIAVARQTRCPEDPLRTRPRLLCRRKRGGRGACVAQQQGRSVSLGRPHQRKKRRSRWRGVRGSGGRSQGGGGWRGRAPRSGLTLEPPSPPHATSAEGAEHLLSAEGRRPSVAARWATTGGHGAAMKGARAGRWRLRGRAWRRRLRRGPRCAGGFG
ncbi:hypothetical protein GUJ93_ZPchr0004g39104 [Zizania palustris]|uniref:Uncharacterized protein n=1 Tax=Zizania palustris TaxID=103762 RepID=A0A8J5S5B9_ZIZPA|nr:hypothetical protein GUJ93_ZPchr0004g39104 [Zizania palustris]